MSYYPKSQIITNLYTNGNELFLQSDGSPYAGFYYKTSNGSYFSGKTPQDIPSVKLLPFSLLYLHKKRLIVNQPL